MMRAAKVCLRTTKEGGLLVNLFIPSVHTHAHRHMHIHTQTHMQTQTPTHLPTQKAYTYSVIHFNLFSAILYNVLIFLESILG